MNSVVLSVFALVMSGLAILASYDISRKNNKLQRENNELQKRKRMADLEERLLNIENAREKDRIKQSKTAKLLAQSLKRNNFGILRIENRGNAEA